MTVLLPTNCTHQRMLSAIHESGEAEATNQEILVRAESGAFVHSSAIALLCCWGLLRIQSGCRFRFVGDQDTLQYLAHMDLLRLLGASHDETYARRDEAGRFIALRLVENRDASLRAALEAIVALVEAQHGDAPAIVPALRWAVAEVLDNVGNHAQSPVPGVMCAQFYPQRHRIDVAVCDMGRGIKASLSTRFPQLDSHGDAVNKALQSGMTRNLSVGQGSGLSGCVEIVAANGGDLHIWTGDVDFAYARGKRRGFDKVQPLPGTGVLLRLRTDHPVDLSTATIGGVVEASLHDVARVREAQEERLSVAALCTHTEGRGPARDLCGRVLARVAPSSGDARAVTLDFTGVHSATSSFLDELLGRLVSILGQERCRRLVGVANMSDSLRGMAGKVIEQRLSTTDEEPSGNVARGQSGAVLRVRLQRLVQAEVIVVFGEDPMFEPLVAAYGVWPAVIVHRIALVPGWQSEVAKVRAMVGSKAALLLPELKDLEDAHARELGIEAQGSLGEQCVREWLATNPIVPFTALLPRQAAESARKSWFRKEIWRRDLLRSVTEVRNSAGLAAGVHAQFQWTLFGFGPLREREAAHTVSFLDGAAVLAFGGKEAALLKDVERLRSQFGKQCGIGFRAVWESGDHPVTMARHAPSLRDAKASLDGRGGTMPLAELVDSVRVGVHAIMHRLTPSDSGPVRMITGRHLAAGLVGLSLQDLDAFDGVLTEPPLQGGEILVATLFGGRPPGRIRVAVVPQDLNGAHAHHSVFVIAAKDQRARDLLADYLQSDFVAAWIRSSGGGGVHVTAAQVRDLPVPRWENDLVQIVEDLAAAANSVDAFRERFDAARRSVFSIGSLNEELAAIQKTAAQAQLVRQFVESIDDLAANIRRTLPLPLAQGWRSLEAEVDERRRYAAGLELFESAMVYVALMLLADVRAESRSMSKVDEILQCFRTPERGPALGLWIEVQSQCPTAAPEELKEKSAFPELRLLVAQPSNSPYCSVVARLKQRRNDHAHGRGPKTEGELREGVAANQSDLEALFRELLFLARYPLRLVEAVDFDELESRRTIAYRDLVGDHPIVPRRRKVVAESVGNGLYIVDQHGEMRLASPWLIYEECPECGHMEICAPEYGAPKRERERGVFYKSLTTGHLHPGRATDWARLAKYVGRASVESSEPQL